MKPGYAVGMAGLRFLCCALLSLLAGVLLRAQSSQDLIPIAPRPVIAGSPELIRVGAPAATGVEGQWLGHKLQFFPARDRKGWVALAGVDVEAAPGPSKLQIHIRQSPGARDLAQAIEIHPAHYRTAVLTVPPKFVAPGPEELKQIAADNLTKARIFGASAPEPLWHGNFRAPVRAAPTDSFGTRRTFNGTLASIHKGMDFRASMGTVVRASNSGTVVLARRLYYEGNCVIIDHGLGLFTLSMHFSRIDVREGQQVAAGDRLGLSGATGRVTGPHLHWAVRWEGAYLDPAKLLQMNLSDIP